MAMRMVNLHGDGNGYVGNPDLKPEQATTLSASADWHDASGERWGVRVTPYYTHVRHYVDALRCGAGAGAMSACNAANLVAQDAFVYLRFTNQTVRLYGIDLSGFTELGRSPRWGQWVLSGGINYVRGKNTDTGDHLIHMMPLNARLALTHRLGSFQRAEDALQEASLSALSHWARDGLPQSPQGWLIRVAFRKALDQLRSEGRDGEREAAAQLVNELLVWCLKNR